MADVFKTPGVYIKEIPTFPPSVAEVETAIPAFIGYTERSSFNGNDFGNQPQRIGSLLEYEQLFGLAEKEKAIIVTISDSSAGGTRTINAAIDPSKRSKFRMYYALQMYFANGGGPCYIVSAAHYDAAGVSADKLNDGLVEIGKFDEPTLLLFPDGPSMESSLYYGVINKALAQCFILQDRFTIIDVKQSAETIDDIRSSAEDFRNSATLGSNLDLMKYGAAYFPDLQTILNYRFDDTDVTIVYQVDGVVATDADPAKRLDLGYILNPRPALTPSPTVVNGLNLRKPSPVIPASPVEPPLPAGNSELYNLIKQQLQGLQIIMPPSSAVAGIYASVDASRGVWKAPANVTLAYVNAATLKISAEDQMSLNVDPTSGKSINAIRYFTGKGVMVWGARTLAGNDNEWRYVPVRRFFIFAEESIKKGSEWVVFEPNDANTWVRVRAMIENFLIKQWRAGALAGAKPEQAFFVRVGLGQTMTALDILEGRMNIEIGMAVVRPAEFIILKFSHKLQES